MALKKPLVLYSGLPGQLQSGDTLDITGITSGEVISQTNDESGAIVICTPVYNDAADGVKKARANAGGTSGVIGLVKDASISNGVAGNIQLDGVLSATTTQWDAVFGTTGGLAFGTLYFLSSSVAGQGTATAPSSVGQYVVILGRAISTTELLLATPFMPVLL